MQPTFWHITDKQKTLLFFGFLAAYFVAAIINLGLLPLNGEEPRRALISIEMLQNGNYTAPTTMGWEYYNKPPVYNWILALSMWLTGSTSEMAVRLPSLVFMVLWAISNFYIVRKLSSVTVAILSSVFFLTSFDIYFWGLNNGGEIDIFYGFIAYLQIASIFYFNHTRQWTKLYFWSGLLCAIGFLTKGFPSILFEGLTLLVVCIMDRSIRVLLKWQVLLGLLAFILPVGGYLLVYSNSGGNLNRFLINLLKESFNKSAIGEQAEKFIRKSIAYPFEFLKNLAPWSLFLLFLFQKRIRTELFKNQLVRFSFLFILINILPYWFTGHPKMRYVYMFLPFAMIIIANIVVLLGEQYRQMVDKILRWLIILFAGLLIGLIVLPFYKTVPVVSVVVGAVLLAVFIFLYWKAARPNLLLYFCAGIVLLRLVFSITFLPLRKDQMSLRYDKQMQAMATANNNGPVTFYTKPNYLQLEIDMKVASFDFGAVPDIPYVAYQMPYYYYKATGKVILYDTLLNKGQSYIGLGSQVDSLPKQTLYTYKDPNQYNENVILFRLDDNQ